MVNPPEFHHNNSETISPNGEGIFFFTEKQTDESHLFALSQPFSFPPSSTPQRQSQTNPRSPQPNSPAQEPPYPLYFPYNPAYNFSNEKLLQLNELALELLGDASTQTGPGHHSKINLRIKFSNTVSIDLLCNKQQSVYYLQKFLNLYFDKNVKIVFNGKIIKDESKPLSFFFQNLSEAKILLL